MRLFWDRHASRYGRRFPISPNVRRHFERLGARCGRTLDHGCGAGRHLVFLAGLGLDVYGFDHSEEALREAARRAPGLVDRLTRGSMFDLRDQYEDGMFDTVLSWAVLYECPLAGFVAAIGEVERVLRPGGKLFASLRLGPPPAGAELQAAGGAWWVVRERHGLVRTYLTRDEARARFERFGLTLVHSHEPLPYGSRGRARLQELVFEKTFQVEA